MYNNYNPYQQGMYNVIGQQPSYNQLQQNNMMGIKHEVIRVNGRNGAQAYQLAPNSSILLLDQTAPIVWLKMTDGAGYPTITPYDISPHQTQQQKQAIDLSEIEKRITRLEDIINDQFSQSNTELTQPIKRVVAASKELKSNQKYD